MGFSEKTVVAIVLALILIFLIVFILNFVYNKGSFSLKILFEDTFPKIFSGFEDIFKG
jgi:hypothetical protein